MERSTKEVVAEFTQGTWARLGIGLLGLVALSLLVFGIWRGFWVTSVENYELAYSFDRFSGRIERIHEQGWVVRTPIRHKVHTIDLRPYQITISANQRVLNAKLVRFKPEGLETFLEWHGRGAGEQLHQLLDILKCYAFAPDGGKDCPFLEVIQDIAPQQGGSK